MKTPKHREPSHPVIVLLEDFLKPMNISQSSLAKHLGWTHARLNEIINGKRCITPDTDLSLAESFNTSPDFWLNLQYVFDLWHARKKHKSVGIFRKGC